MLNEGYNDLVLLIGNEEIPSISSILCVSNPRLKSIIKDENADKQILLPDHLTKKAFSLLCRYYGYGIIEIDRENVSELLLCCICLNETSLLSKCRLFILSHQNETLVMNIFNMMKYIPDNYMEDIKTTICNYITLNCISILDNNEIFKLLHLDSLKVIITLENLLVPSEKYLLDKILKHYNENIEKISNNDEKDEKYNEVMKYLNWRKLDIREVDEKDLDIIDTKTIKKSKSEKPIKRKYGRKPETNNKILNEMILNGIKDIDLIKDIFYEDCEYLLSLENTLDEISNYLKESQYLIEIITILRLINKLNINKKDLILNDEDIENITTLLIEMYKENEDNKEEKSMIVECLFYFFDDKCVIESIRKSIRYTILTDILNNEVIEDKSFIIEYIKRNVDEEKKNLILSNIVDEDIKKRILPGFDRFTLPSSPDPPPPPEADAGFGAFPTDDGAGGDGGFVAFPADDAAAGGEGFGAFPADDGAGGDGGFVAFPADDAAGGDGGFGAFPTDGGGDDGGFGAFPTDGGGDGGFGALPTDGWF